jgi:hypothetical protein
LVASGVLSVRSKSWTVAGAAWLLSMGACVVDDEEAIPDAGVTPTPTFTYADDVEPLIGQHCRSCHRAGGPAPFALESYGNAASRAAAIKDAVITKRMPHGMPMRLDTGCIDEEMFQGPRRLTPDEIDLITTWVDEGAPEGEPRDVSRAFHGWERGEPDLELRNDADGFTVPGGVDRDIFRRFVIPTDLDGDTFITGFETIPGNGAGEKLSRVVHHVTLFIDPDGNALEQERAFAESNPEIPGPGFEGEFQYPVTLVGMWFPGSGPLILPEGLGVRIPKGAAIVMEVHYAPYDDEVVDRTEVGLYLADTVQSELAMGLVANEDFVVPAGDADFEVTAERTFDETTTLYALTPHMHQTGTDFHVTVERPGDASMCLADVEWDFEHQGSYWLTRPLTLAPGSSIRTRCVYDNSANNPNQFNDPPRDLEFGRDADLEMCQLTIGIVRSAPEEPPEGDPILVEVLYDAVGDDDGVEWVKFQNPTEYPIDLSSYSLGWGGLDYTYGTSALGGTIAPGECFVVGAVPPGTLGFGAHFRPNLQNGGAEADGIALFAGPAEDITAESVPVGVVIYGGPTNANELIDETGEPAEVDIAGALAGQSIRRIGDEWLAGEPRPTACP